MTTISLDNLALVHGGLDLGPAKRTLSRGAQWGVNGGVACGAGGIAIGGTAGAFGGPATAAAGAGIGGATGVIACGVGGFAAGVTSGAIDELRRR